ncbi:MAG: hypothetical protein AAF950_07145 [Pseudomonadota bacterium]
MAVRPFPGFGGYQGYQGYQGYSGHQDVGSNDDAQIESIAQALAAPNPAQSQLQAPTDMDHQIAELLMQRGMSSEPIYHWAGGLARMGTAAIAAWKSRKNERQQAEYDASEDERIQGLVDALMLGPRDRAAFELTGQLPQAQQGPEPFTLNPGQARFSPDGSQIAALDAPPPDLKPVEGDGDIFAFNPQTGGAVATGIGNKPRSAPINIQTGDVDQGQRPILGQVPKGMQGIYDPEKQRFRYEPVQGSDVERDRAQAGLRAFYSIQASEEQFTTVSSAIDRAIEQADFWSAGLMAQATQDIGSTPARNLKATLDAVVANIGFDKLQEMRDSSATGAALGNVTEKEITFLQSVRGSLDQIQSPEQLISTLGDVKASIQRLLEYERIIYEIEYGGLANGGARTIAPTGPQTELPPGFEVVE